MAVKNCRKCGKIFNHVMGPVYCVKCREDMEEKFQEVKRFIRENPGVGVSEVSEACDVESSQIYQWLREERLQLAEGSMITLSCESCMRPINSGRYCENCKRELASGLKKAIAQPKIPQPVKKQPKDTSSRMRFL